MKLTYQQLILTALKYDELRQLKLPVAQLLRLRQAMKFLSEQISLFDEVRKEVVAKYNLADEKERERADQELMEALQQTVEFPNFEPIPIRYLEGQTLSLDFIEKTDWLWEFDESA
ncbi:MAG: hypothetical protein ACPLPV_00160 [Methanomassiliicoccales archaeon]